MLVPSAASTLVPLGLQTLIAADADAPASSSCSPGGCNVATRTIAASPSAVRCVADGTTDDADDGGGGEGNGDGCWVSYGWRRRPRRLPPAIPPLRRLARERTADGRLVISREEAAHRVYARKVDDHRLVLEFVDERDGGEAPPPPQRRWSHPLAGQEATASASAAGEDAARAPVVSASPPVPPEACFEGAIRVASLPGMRLSLPRMVH